MADVNQKKHGKTKTIKTKKTRTGNISENISDNNKVSGKSYFRMTMIVIIVLSIGIMLGVISYTIYKINGYNSVRDRVISYKEIDASVQIVAFGAGMDGNKTAFKFGKVGLGGSSTKYIEVNTSEDALIQIYTSGPIAQFVDVDANNFTIGPSNITIPIYLTAPENAVIGNYTGKVHILLLKPK